MQLKLVLSVLVCCTASSTATSVTLQSTSGASDDNDEASLPSVELSAFMSWMAKGGAEFKSVTVASRGGRRGVFAVNDISEGEVLIRIPYDLIITKEALAKHAESLCTDTSTFHGTEQGMIASAILFEKALGSESPWHHVLSVLPKDFDTPVWWPEEDVELLRGSAMHLRARAAKRQIIQGYERIVEKCPDFGRKFDEKEWRWALQAVRSRVFGVRSKRHGDAKQHMVMMVPLADMANHHEDANTTWYFSDDTNAFEVRAKVSIPAGIEIFDSYGQKSADVLLETYGFLPDPAAPGSRATGKGQTVPQEALAKAMLRVPLCMPPSLERMTGSESLAALRKQLLKVDALKPCCEKVLTDNGASGGRLENSDDEKCFADQLRKEEIDESLFLVLGRPARASEETRGSQLAKVLAHFRLLAVESEETLKCVAEQVPSSETPARSFAEWTTPCAEQDCWPSRYTKNCHQRLCPQLLPITRKTEATALKLLAALMRAHLRQTSWVDRGSIEKTESEIGSDGPEESARRWHIALVRRYLRSERNMLEWHLELISLVMPLLELANPRALEAKICEMASMRNRTLRARIRDFGTFIDTSLGPLAFLPWPDEIGGQPCSVVHTTHALTKSCLAQEISKGVDSMIDAFRKEHGYAALDTVADAGDSAEL